VLFRSLVTATLLLLVRTALALDQMVTSFVDLTSASVARTVTTISLSSPITDAYSFTLPTVDHAAVTCAGDSCTVSESPRNTFTVSGSTNKIVVKFATSRNQKPLPESVDQTPKKSVEAATQYLLYTQKLLAFNIPYQSSTTLKVIFRLPNQNVKSFTPINPASKNANEVTYGPYKPESLAGGESISLHYQTSDAILNVEFVRLVQVSHWAGNVNFEDHFTIYHEGARIKGHFSNIDFRMFQHTHQDSNVVKSFPLSLPPNSKDVYYKDSIGNVSTSNFRPSRNSIDRAILDIRPRYPLYGGWKYKFFYGFNVPSTAFLKQYTSDSSKFQLSVPMFDTLKNLSYISTSLQIQLPEGAKITNIEYSYNADITKFKTYTYLDTIGRTTIKFTKSNAVDEVAGPIKITYSFPLYLLLLKPLAVALAMMLMLISSMVYARADFAIESDPKEEFRRKLGLALLKVNEGVIKIDALFESQRAAFNTLEKGCSVDEFKKKIKSYDASIVSTLDSGALGSAGKEVAALYRERLRKVQDSQLRLIGGGKVDIGGDDVSGIDEKIKVVLGKLNEKLQY